MLYEYFYYFTEINFLSRKFKLALILIPVLDDSLVTMPIALAEKMTGWGRLNYVL